MNVEDWRASPLDEIVARIDAEARARGVDVAGSELVGLMPEGAANPVRRRSGWRASTRRTSSSRGCLDSTRDGSGRLVGRGADGLGRLGGGRRRDAGGDLGRRTRSHAGRARRRDPRRARRARAHVRHQHGLRTIRLSVHPGGADEELQLRLCEATPAAWGSRIPPRSCGRRCCCARTRSPRATPVPE